MSNITPIGEDRAEIAAALPSSCSTRWNSRRKAAVVRAVLTGVISLDQAQAIYRLSVSEFYSWKRFLDAEGVEEVVARSLGIRTPSELDQREQSPDPDEPQPGAARGRA